MAGSAKLQMYSLHLAIPAGSVFNRYLVVSDSFATPRTVACQAPLSMGFPRQAHWSGLPFPSPMHETEKWKLSRSVVSDLQRPRGLQPSRLLRPWDFPGKSTGVGCHCLLCIQKVHGYLFQHGLQYRVIRNNSGIHKERADEINDAASI